MLVAAACAAAAVPAYGAAIPGATYAASLPGGGSFTFTVSPDGTLIQSFHVSVLLGNTCQFSSDESVGGGWPGAPIVDNSFSYGYGVLASLDGAFTGPQSATGTIHFYQAAGPGGSPPACDSGIVTWTAATGAVPPPGGGGGGGGGNGNGNGNGKHHFSTSVKFGKLSRTKDGGRLISSSATCRAGRRVILWRGKKRIGTTKSTAKGKFVFRRSAKVRGHRVRATVAARTVGAGICMAGSSTFIAG